ncbi:LytTR family DNA-binding domain-containing protein [Bacteroidales bacterium OttesenSCG-928-M06]|nr:LytTR family DNA-binding domain-containing protein [Bacteroidales bacterium OttesenSCG-928-M06]
MIDCIIVEDAPLATEKLKDFINQIPFLNLMESFDKALDALTFMRQHKVNLVFLDIQMEELNGLQFMEVLPYKPKIIIVSAYSKYAIHGFEHNVSDYILKPYSFERFLKAVNKVYAELREHVSRPYMFVKTEYRMERIDFKDILYVEGKGAYLRIVTNKTKIMTLLSFSEIERILPAGNFIRVHKSFLVALDKIDHVERNIIRISDQNIPIGKVYQDNLFRLL